MDRTTFEPLLTDFGLAKDIESESQVTRSGMTLGTPNYMPPEQADGRLDDIDERSDVYSLGATFYEMLVLRPPFEGASVAEIIRKIFFDDPVPPRRLNRVIEKDLETICLKCLEKDPGRRYPDAKSLAADLKRFLDGRPILARPASPLVKLLKRVRRNRLASLALFVLALVLCGGGVAGWIGLNKWLEERGEKEAAKAETESEKTARLEAEADRDKAERIKKKSDKVNRVLMAANARLGGVLIELKKGFYGLPGIQGRMNALYDQHRQTIDDFYAGVPSDPTSQATGLAVKAWFLRFGGYDQEARAALARSQNLDAEVPWGFLFEAMICLSVYVSEQPLSGLKFSIGGNLDFEPPPRDPRRVRQALDKLQGLIGKIAKATVWNEESVSDLREAMTGFEGMVRGDLEAADRGLTRALKVMELSWMWETVLLARAKVRYSRMRFSEGLPDVEKILGIYPQDKDAQSFKASLLLGDGIVRSLEGRDARDRFQESIEMHTKALALDPMDVWEHIYRGRVHWSLAEVMKVRGEDAGPSYKRSIEDYTRALDLEPGTGLAQSHRAGVHWSYGEYLEARGEDPRERFLSAIADYTEVLEGKDFHVGDVGRRGLAYRSLGDAQRAHGEDPRESFRRAIEDCTTAVEGDARNWEALNHRGLARQSLAEALASVGESPWETYDQAIEDFTKALSVNPKSGMAYDGRANVRWSLGEALMRSGRDPIPAFRQALADCEEAQRRVPQLVFPYSTSGAVYESWGDYLVSRGEDPRPIYRKAIAAYTKAAEKHAGAMQVYYNRGLAQKKLADAQVQRGVDPRQAYESSLKDCTEALRRNPKLGEAHVVRGLVFAGLGRLLIPQRGDPREHWKEAIREFSRALALNPRSAMALVNRGNVRRSLGTFLANRGHDPKEMWEKAAEDFGRALDLDPDSHQACYGRGVTWIRLNRPAAAVRDLEKAVGLAGTVPHYVHWLGRARNLLTTWTWVEPMVKAGDLIRRGDYRAAREALEKGLADAERAGVHENARHRPTLIAAHQDLAALYAVASKGKESKQGDPAPVSEEHAEACLRKGLESLRRALELGWADFEAIRKNPDLAALREHPEFEPLLKEYEEKKR
jgi:serine/threonine-protein kinase